MQSRILFPRMQSRLFCNHGHRRMSAVCLASSNFIFCLYTCLLRSCFLAAHFCNCWLSSSPAGKLLRLGVNTVNEIACPPTITVKKLVTKYNGSSNVDVPAVNDHVSSSLGCSPLSRMLRVHVFTVMCHCIMIDIQLFNEPILTHTYHADCCAAHLRLKEVSAHGSSV